MLEILDLLVPLFLVDKVLLKVVFGRLDREVGVGHLLLLVLDVSFKVGQLIVEGCERGLLLLELCRGRGELRLLRVGREQSQPRLRAIYCRD